MISYLFQGWRASQKIPEMLSAHSTPAETAIDIDGPPEEEEFLKDRDIFKDAILLNLRHF